MSDLLILPEHADELRSLPLPADQAYSYVYPFQKRQGEQVCFRISPTAGGHRIETSYYIGVDWIGYGSHAVYVQPKMNAGDYQTDYLQMLAIALRHPDVSAHTGDLFEIKYAQPSIEIGREQDLLTPLLAVQFLSVVKALVQRGLKKSYYRVERNLNGRIKGKINRTGTIQHNILKNKSLHTLCVFDEFGLNSPENRLLKKTLLFVQQYLSTMRHFQAEAYVTDTLRFVLPAFTGVSENADPHEWRHPKKNALYGEYEEGIRLAKLILQRFGFHLSNVQTAGTMKTPPFWIDMSRLFELYVLGLLKDRFPGPKEVLYHYTVSGNELDFVLNTPDYKMVIDAKYKPKYEHSFGNDDIRQVSGYARSKFVYKHLGKTEQDVIDCLIVYPDRNLKAGDIENRDLKAEKIGAYVGFYKLGVGLPVL